MLIDGGGAAGGGRGADSNNCGLGEAPTSQVASSGRAGAIWTDVSRRTKPAVRPPSLAVECTMAVPSLASIVAAAAWMAAAGSAACVMQLAEG